jgi:hypothetical protein
MHYLQLYYAKFLLNAEAEVHQFSYVVRFVQLNDVPLQM